MRKILVWLLLILCIAGNTPAEAEQAKKASSKKKQTLVGPGFPKFATVKRTSDQVCSIVDQDPPFFSGASSFGAGGGCKVSFNNDVGGRPRCFITVAEGSVLLASVQKEESTFVEVYVWDRNGIPYNPYTVNLMCEFGGRQ